MRRRAAAAPSLRREKPEKPERLNRVRAARAELLEGVGEEVAASFPGITRLGGQVVAALYLDDRAAVVGRSMEELSKELGRAKSNIFENLRALEAAGIVERRRSPGARHDRFLLRGPYPDVIVGAYVARLRWVIGEKRALVERSLALLGDEAGRDADELRGKLAELGRKYATFAAVFERVAPSFDGPIDLEPLLAAIPIEILDAIARQARAGNE